MKISLEVTVAAINWPVVILKPSSLLVFVVALVVSLKLPMLSIKSIATSLAVLEKRTVHSDTESIEYVTEAIVHLYRWELNYY